MIEIEGNDVRGVPGGQSGRHAQRLRPALYGICEEIGADERRRVACKQRARALRQALRIFERAQFLRRIDEDIAVGADPEAPTRGEIVDRRKNAVAQITFGDRAQSGDRAACGKPRDFVGIKVSRVDEAPAFVDPGVIEQPFNRSRAAPCDAVGDFLHLFGGVDMHRPCRRQVEQRRQFIGRHGAKRVGRDPDIGVAGEFGPRGVEQRGKAVDVVEETPLPRARRRRIEIAMRVKDGEQRQPDPARRARFGDRARHLGAIGIGSARRIMVQIMKFADAGEPRLQHLDIGLGGDRRDILGR